MVTTETFYHAVWAASPGRRIPRKCGSMRPSACSNTVDIGHELGAKFAVYWPGSLGYYVQGAVEETQTLRWYAEALNAACERDIEVAAKKGRPTLQPLHGGQALRAAGGNPAAHQRRHAGLHRLRFAHASGDGGPQSGISARADVGRRAACRPRRALVAGKLWHFDINDGYRLKHDVDIAVGLVNPLDWLNVLVLLRSHDYNGPFNLDYKPPRTTSNHGVFSVSFPTAVDRFITLWEMAGEVLSDPIINEATEALKAGGEPVNARDAEAITAATRELLTLHELIAHRLVQILLGLHRGRTYSI